MELIEKPGNNFFILILFIIAILVAFALTVNGQSKEFCDAINKIRESKGLPTLVYSKKLERSSDRWLEKSRQINCLKHELDIDYAEVMCMISSGVITVDDAVLSLMKSPPHYRILMSRQMKEMGVAFMNNKMCARLDY